VRVVFGGGGMVFGGGAWFSGAGAVYTLPLIVSTDRYRYT
jgi:hypothetical protein